MLFRHLSKPDPGALVAMVEGYVVSIVAHVALIAAFVAPRSVPDPDRPLPESFEWARFLVPEDRPAGSSGSRGEHITWFAPSAPGGAGTEILDRREPERIELQVPEGTRTDELAVAAVPPAPAEEVRGDEVMTVLEVDSAAIRVEDGAAPPYPPTLLARRIEGSVAVQYVVDTAGRADTSSFRVLEATHPEFAQSVKETLPHMRFRAAKMNDTKVRQLVQQLFSFRIDTTLIGGKKKPIG